MCKVKYSPSATTLLMFKTSLLVATACLSRLPDACVCFHACFFLLRYRATSLLYCFPSSYRLINLLLSSGSYMISSKQERTELLQLFQQPSTHARVTAAAMNNVHTTKYLPPPDSMEYTLFAPSTVHPNVGTRMYTHVSSRSFRMATALFSGLATAGTQQS